jgi:glycolate oxidase iron-sulfur subunit
VLLGDELDSPRGRIYLIKEMLEADQPATAEVVKHIDRCLSCLSCMTTCPSGVHYMHLVDHAREHIEETYRRPALDRALRALLAHVLPNPGRLTWALRAAALGKPFAPVLAAAGFERLAAMLRLAPVRPPRRPDVGRRKIFPAAGRRQARIAILTGCANPVLAPEINEAAIRLLTRHGVEVVLAEGEGCCGALVHHLGRAAAGLQQVRGNVDAWMRELEGEGLDAILITASGCGTMVKDYGHLLRTDQLYADHAARISALAMDVTEYLARMALVPVQRRNLTVAYHAACSLQHGQKVTREPKELLSKFGFVVEDVPEGHLCCGSAGTYNILQPAIARRLRDRKVENIRKTQPDVIATGNIGCITQIATGTEIPIVHTVELIDWATGGLPPRALRRQQIPPAEAQRAEAVA